MYLALPEAPRENLEVERVHSPLYASIARFSSDNNQLNVLVCFYMDVY